MRLAKDREKYRSAIALLVIFTNNIFDYDLNLHQNLNLNSGPFFGGKVYRSSLNVDIEY